MLVVSLVLLLSAVMVHAQPLGNKSLDEVSTKIINLAVTTKKVKSKKKKLVKGSLAGLIVGIVIFVIILAFIAYLLYRRQQKKKALGVKDPNHVNEHKLTGTEPGLAPPIVHEHNGVAGQQRTDGVGHV